MTPSAALRTDETKPDPVPVACWCGNINLLPFGAGYLRCAVCETLVVAEMPRPEELIDAENDGGFYGPAYYETYQKSLGLPSLSERARADLSERCCHWLDTFLKYKQPPASVLDLGCAHGGFVAMLKAAGFAAEGLEVSKSLADFARRTFNVPVLVGPIEEQAIGNSTLDAIAMMDVLEHLPNPEQSLSHCKQVLKPSGIVLIQTPQYREGRSLQEMQAQQDPFLFLLTPGQHLYLFSRRSVQLFLVRCGFSYIQFEPAIFSAYDMFLAASPQAFPALRKERIENLLADTVEARWIAALLEAARRSDDFQARLLQSEADRANRLAEIERQGRQIIEIDSDRAARLATVQQEERRIAELERKAAELQMVADAAERRASDAVKLAAGLEARLLESEADRANRLAEIERQGRQIAEIDADRTTRLIAFQEQENAARAAEQVAKTLTAGLEATTAALSALQRQLFAEQQMVLDRDSQIARQQEEIHSLSAELADLRAAKSTISDQLTEQKRLLEALASVQPELAMSARRKRLLATIERSPVYRLTRSLGLWGSLDLSSSKPPKRLTENVAKLSTVVINLTPVLPGGANGGAKFLAVELVRNLAILAPQCEFLLLTSKAADEELSVLDAFNVRRLCVDSPVTAPSKVKAPAEARLAKRLPKRAADQPMGDYLVKAGADLLFCPFTAPSHSDRRIPVVSVVLDVQFLDYPQFFEPDEVAERDRNYRAACNESAKIICISEFVRGTVLANSARKPSDVEAVHISLEDRVASADTSLVDRVLFRYQIEPRSFVLYPANFWKHKNHEILLTAFGMYRARNPSSKLKLVLTGAPGERMEYLSDATEIMGLSEHVVFAGFVPDREVTALLQYSMALIFPSLYEGFGIPVLEAMSMGTPVLCGNRTSLPEVAGDAALLFDPRMPAEIVHAIEKLENDPELRRDLAARGLARSEKFGSSMGMAATYLKVFREVVRGHSMFSKVGGVYHDGWASEKVQIVVAPDGSLARTLHLSAIAPHFFPDEPVHLEVLKVNEGTSEYVTLSKEQPTNFVLFVDPAGSRFEITAERAFCPRELGVGQDSRKMSFKLLAASVQDEKGGITALHW